MSIAWIQTFLIKKMNENLADGVYLFLVKCRRQGHILGRDVRFKQLEYGKTFGTRKKAEV